MELLSRGCLQKMHSENNSGAVHYSLALGDSLFSVNDWLGSSIGIQFSGAIYCVHCQRKTKKSFGQGYCYPCFIRLAQCDTCIVKPEQCHYHLGTCREPTWAEQHCLTDHVVYLANSSGLKVGITRATQIPTRWIDQGATQALPIIKVKTRRQSGLVEVMFKQYVSDKTHWQQMLKSKASPLDLFEKRDELFNKCKNTLAALQDEFGIQAIQTLEAEIIEIDYPVLNYPVKVSSFNLDKNPLVQGQLLGIKGQYLMFDSGVLNVRNFSGYEVEIFK